MQYLVEAQLLSVSIGSSDPAEVKSSSSSSLESISDGVSYQKLIFGRLLGGGVTHPLVTLVWMERWDLVPLVVCGVEEGLSH